ncbi:hypothetical protein [Bifidobacterium sp. ESL0745]|uniref:hypothetical protein n=1 Tax=Bifidobacterium sp. ESL0745 TaxID=2983226 RepID=UPI0023F9D3B7|nr:hypothetical protein [Bifidobacterium sp. ESL0745]MDF7666152.1 hypothetical protein [Bifidobacterium sp. ESL0745]
MKFIKQQSVGFYVNALALIVGIAAVAYYLVNAHTDTFTNIGTSALVMALTVLALLMLVAVLVIRQMPIARGFAANTLLDVCSLAAPVLLIVSVVSIIASRVDTFASILTFQQNAHTTADMHSAIVAIVAYFVAALLAVIASFFKVNKNEQ